MSIDYFISRFNSFSLDTKGLTEENLSARIKKKIFHKEGSKHLVVFLPTWGGVINDAKRLQKFVLQNNGSLIVYEFPREILSSDINLTKQCFDEIKRIVKADIQQLKIAYGFSTCTIIGTSIGSISAAQIIHENPDVDSLILIVPSCDLAESVWTGCRTQHLRKSYEIQKIDLDELKKRWFTLAPINNLPSKNVSTAVFLSQADKVILYRLGKQLANAIQEKSSHAFIKENRYFGHYITMLFFYRFPAFFLREISLFAKKVEITYDGEH